MEPIHLLLIAISAFIACVISCKFALVCIDSKPDDKDAFSIHLHGFIVHVCGTILSVVSIFVTFFGGMFVLADFISMVTK